MFSLAFSGNLGVTQAISDLPTWLVPLTVCICLAIAGGMMLFSPNKAFRTERKPRWIGLPLFALGIVGAVEWLAQIL